MSCKPHGEGESVAVRPLIDKKKKKRLIKFTTLHQRTSPTIPFSADARARARARPAAKVTYSLPDCVSSGSQFVFIYNNLSWSILHGVRSLLINIKKNLHFYARLGLSDVALALIDSLYVFRHEKL